MASTPIAMASIPSQRWHGLLIKTSTLIKMASNLLVIASDGMASNLLVIDSTLLAMASNAYQ